MQSAQVQIIIVGGGPAGLGAALHIARRLPHLAPHMLILEAAEHPRPKLCGGGVTVHGEAQLRQLGIHVDVPAFTVDQVTFRLGARAFTVFSPGALRIIQRAEFDAALAHAVAASGIRLHANERLLDIAPVPGGMRLTTHRGQYEAPIVIGADGANSTVRQKLGLHHHLGVARLLRILTPVDPRQNAAWREKTAVFDFTCVTHGIQGYAWDFPCYVDGAPFMNRGIFDSRIDPPPAGRRINLKQAFAHELHARAVDLQAYPLAGHPVRWFNPNAAFSQPHVLLAGDAAGVDPLFAEGISYALEYGEIVAACVEQALATGDFSFGAYRAKLRHHRLGRLLKRRTIVARSLYLQHAPRFWLTLWQLAAIAPTRVQRLVGASLGLLPR